MSRHDSRRRMIASTAAIGVAIAVWALPARLAAADLDSSLFGVQPPTQTQPVEFGTGWYIRGSVDAAYQIQPSLLPNYLVDPPGQSYSGISPSAQSYDWAAEIGFGYTFNKWFRTDLTYSYYGTQKVSGNGSYVNCPASLNPLYSNPPTDTILLGVTPDPSQCTPQESAYLQKNLALANAYLDLGTWYGVTPYVGAGVGIAYIVGNQAVNFVNNSNGTPYDATLTLPNPYPVPLIYYNAVTGQPLAQQPHYSSGQQNWDVSNTTKKLNFAFALMAGFSYDLTSNAKLDIGYRYANFGSVSSIGSVSGSLVNQPITTQEIRIGLRYLID
jgi:opacity protein-like surface antigen